MRVSDLSVREMHASHSLAQKRRRSFCRTANQKTKSRLYSGATLPPLLAAHTSRLGRVWGVAPQRGCKDRREKSGRLPILDQKSPRLGARACTLVRSLPFFPVPASPHTRLTHSNDPLPHAPQDSHWGARRVLRSGKKCSRASASRALRWRLSAAS